MATVRKHRGNWVADYRDQFGKRHRERPTGHFENMAQQKRAAQSLLKKRLDEVDRGSYSADSRKLTFSQVAGTYLDSKVNIRPSTRRNYESQIKLYLQPYFGAWKIRQISVSDVEKFRSALAEELPLPIVDAFAKRLREAHPALSQAQARKRVLMKRPSVRTINKLLTMASMIFNYAVKHQWVDRNPVEHVEKLRPPMSVDAHTIDANILSPKEIQALLNAADAGTCKRDGKLFTNNYRLLIQLAVFTGMRSGEIRGLQWGDINWNSSDIHIRRSWKEGAFHQPKTQASIRHIDIPRFLIIELRDWRLACPKREYDLVFPNLAGNPMSSTNLLQRGFYPALRRAGIRKIRFHDLRHTFASLLIANGEDIVRVSRLLGHASPTVTLNVYSHMLPKEHYGSVEHLVNLVFETNDIIATGRRKAPKSTIFSF